MRIGKRERRHREYVLANEVQRLPARNENLQVRRLREEIGKRRRAVDDLLEVVQDQKKVLRREVGGKRLPGGLAHAERPCDGRQQEGGLVQRGEHHRISAVRVIVDQVGGGLQRKTRLPGSAGAGQGDQAHVSATRHRAK